jgi:hypothetical protein
MEGNFDAPDAPRRIKVAVRDEGSDEWDVRDALEFRYPWPDHPERRIYILPPDARSPEGA